jgi:hypothetical protein
MSNKISPIKKFFILLKEATTLIIMGISSFLLLSSGLFIGLIFRYFDYNAGIIIFSSLITELIGLIVLYLLFKGYLKEKEESKENQSINQK